MPTSDASAENTVYCHASGYACFVTMSGVLSDEPCISDSICEHPLLLTAMLPGVRAL